MTKELALLLCTGFISLLLLRERAMRPLSSRLLWIPFLWVSIIGSRPVSAWFEVQVDPVDPDKLAASYLEGTPLDRNIFLALIFAALYILWKRRGDWGSVISNNRWLLAFFIYCGISVLWSDFFFVSLKRWVKDLGNVLMILVILSEPAPFAAVKALFGRYISVAVPLSVLLIKYYPNLGRYYNRWSYEPAYCGVTTNKNELGIILVICGIMLLQDLMEVREVPKEERGRFDVAVPVLLLMMTAWLLRIAGSATSQVCLVLGGLLLVSLRLPQFRSQSRYLGIFAAAAGGILFLIPGIIKSAVTLLGRDATFTGRTEIWRDVLSERINPWIGTGYRSFWLGPAQQRLQLNQAHNGYLETYLNGGLLGLGLLLALLVGTGQRLNEELQLEGDEFTIMRFAFFGVAVCYNWTEAMFNGLSLIWFMLLLAMVVWPEPARHPAASAISWEDEDGTEA